MDDEEKFGPVLHRLTFAQAIEQDLLSDYQVVVVGVSDDEHRAIAERGAFVTRRRRDGHRRPDARPPDRPASRDAKHDLRRVVSFHSRIARRRRFASSLPEMSQWLPAAPPPDGALWTEHVSGEMTDGERDARSTDCRASAQASAACSRTPAASPRASMCRRSTVSPSSTLAARRSTSCRRSAGRSARPRTRRVGTIVIPVFVDEDDDPSRRWSRASSTASGRSFGAPRPRRRSRGGTRRATTRAGRRGSLGKRPGKDRARPSGRDRSVVRPRLRREAGRDRNRELGVLVWASGGLVSREDSGRVPQSHREQDYPLGVWVSTQRQRFGRGELIHRVHRLDGVRG